MFLITGIRLTTNTPLKFLAVNDSSGGGGRNWMMNFALFWSEHFVNVADHSRSDAVVV